MAGCPRWGRPANNVLVENCASAVYKWMAKDHCRLPMTAGRLMPAAAVTGSSKVVLKAAANTRGSTTDRLERTQLPAWVLLALERQTNERRHTKNEDELQRMIARKRMKHTKKILCALGRLAVNRFGCGLKAALR
ncbi:MAG: hypothetical protein ONB48_15615 [candidate division KSB1 bacterium]|nr:hypothetical protein [candidate division KSB1 bacterium]MDZ7276146.1 hypothetical protein [candidate division KSB1 bacterium]MDZ7287074.1 hypothetical protein [candidate division KSB1 bacterium]MDZ7297001.1 hypothetical protein [candidate division KSB1 bacterium]MDZ7306169.1 hypothetical protein [candidate division KSB1 bacterium]